VVPMALIDQIPQPAEAARAWLEARERVLRFVERRFPRLGSVAVEAAVDRAWLDLYERNPEPPEPMVLRRRWQRVAYLRALEEVRNRQRHPTVPVPVDELADHVLVDGRIGPLEATRSQARVGELISQTSGEGRRWLMAVIETPDAPPRELAASLRWRREKLKSVARRTQVQLREFVVARQSGALCERRQAVMDAFAATRLLAGKLEGNEALAGVPTLGEERWEEVAWHIAGCVDCERAWRRAETRLLYRFRLAFPPVLGKVAAAGGSLWMAGRRALLGLRMRLLSSSVGRATAGGATGTAGTAGVLGAKGAAICAGLVCATGVGATALVGLPAAVIEHAPSHHRRAVKASAALRRSPGEASASSASISTAYEHAAVQTSTRVTTTVSTSTATKHPATSRASQPTAPSYRVAQAPSASVDKAHTAKAATVTTSPHESVSGPQDRPAASGGRSGPCLPGLGCR
jgi:hypothetical protein